MDVKHLIVGAIALVVGLAIGGLGPRAQVRTLQAELDLKADQACEDRTGRDIAAMFRGRPWDVDEPMPDEPMMEDEPEDAPADEAPEGGFQVEIGGDDLEDAQTPEEAMELAREAMEVRRSQAIAAFVMGRDDYVDLALAYALINFIGVLAVLEFFRQRKAGPDAMEEGEQS